MLDSQLGVVNLDSYAWGAGPVTASLYATGGQIATLGLQAAEEDSPPPPRGGVDEGRFQGRCRHPRWRSRGSPSRHPCPCRGAAGYLPWGMTGACAGAAALWLLVDSLKDGPYSSAWPELTGKAIDTAGQFVPSGTDLATAKAQGAPAAELPFRVTTTQEDIFDKAAGAIIDIFS